MSDINYYSNVLLLHADGVDAATTITDNSYSAKTVTAVGNAQLDTAQKKYGTASLLLDGSGDYATVPDSADWDFGTGDFTVEMWARFASHTTIQALLSNYLNASTGWAIQRRSDTNVLNFGNGDASLISASWTPADSTWYHIAVCRASGVLRLFVDGVQIGVDTANTTNITGSTSTLFIGTLSAAAQPFAGWLDDIRITKGVGRYTANFTAPTEAHPDTGVTGAIEAELVAPMSTFTAFTGAQATLTAPMGTMIAYTGASAPLTAPMQIVAGSFGGRSLLAAPMQTIRFEGHDSTGENALQAIAPMATLAGHFGGHARLSAPLATMVAEVTGTNLASAALTAPMATLQASGTASALARASLSAPMQTMIGYGGAVISVSCPILTVESSATAGAVGSIAVICPLFELLADVTTGNYGSIELLAPMQSTGQSRLQAWLTAPTARLVAIGTATVTASYEAYALNLNHKGFKDPVDELTRYTNFPFTHIVRYQNSYYGAAADGLYLLEGTTDFAPATPLVPTAIPWAMRTGITDFGSSVKKTPVSVYLRGRLGPAATVTLYTGESGSQSYAYQTTRTADAQNYRQKFGLGIKDSYFAFGLEGEDELALDAAEFNIAQLTRRI